MPLSTSGRTRTASFFATGTLTHDPPIWDLTQHITTTIPASDVPREWESPLYYTAGLSEPNWANQTVSGTPLIDWNGGVEFGLLGRLFRVGVKTNSRPTLGFDRGPATFPMIESAAGGTAGTTKYRLRVLPEFTIYGVQEGGVGTTISAGPFTSDWSSDQPDGDTSVLIWRPSQGFFTVTFDVELRDVVEDRQEYEEYRIVNLSVDVEFTFRFTYFDIDYSPTATVGESVSGGTAWTRLQRTHPHRTIRQYGLGPTLNIAGSIGCDQWPQSAGDSLDVIRAFANLTGGWDSTELAWTGNTDTNWVSFPAVFETVEEAFEKLVVRAPGGTSIIGPDWAFQIEPNTRNYLDQTQLPVTIQHDQTHRYRDALGVEQTISESATWDSTLDTIHIEPRRVPSSGYLNYAYANVDGGLVLRPASLSPGP